MATVDDTHATFDLSFQQTPVYTYSVGKGRDIRLCFVVFLQMVQAQLEGRKEGEGTWGTSGDGPVHP